MSTYYRIQPAGLGIAGHRSLTSNDETPFGVDVFLYAYQIAAPDGPLESYGDEVLLIEAEDDWDNGDAEGVRIDPNLATIVARIPLGAWLQAFEGVDPDDDETVARTVAALRDAPQNGQTPNCS